MTSILIEGIEHAPIPCDVSKEKFPRGVEAYRLSFPVSGGVVTTVRVVFKDVSRADLVITHMTTLPESERRKGHGSRALAQVLAAARAAGMNDIRAVQVQKSSEPFWTRNGFVPEDNITNDFRLTSSGLRPERQFSD